MRNPFPPVRLSQPLCDVWDWQMNAACHRMPASMFYPPTQLRGSAKATAERQAKLVCRQCPVIDQCRRHALDSREEHGIWGGLTSHERLRLISPTRSSS